MHLAQVAVTLSGLLRACLGAAVDPLVLMKACWQGTRSEHLMPVKH